MNNQRSNKNSMVYTTRGFSDTLASPAFYPVLVVSLVLGITSMLGFVQNPNKLQQIVGVVQQKVSLDYSKENLNSHHRNNTISELNNKEPSNSVPFKSTSGQFSLTIKSTTTKNDQISLPVSSTERLTAIKDDYIDQLVFNYDLTAENFWESLDASQLESSNPMSNERQHNNLLIGIPLEADYQETNQNDFDLNDVALYAMSENLYL